MTEKITSRQKKALETKKKICKTAIVLMEKKGFNNVTIKEISKASGVSVGAFYHYFNSKNDIYFEIYRKGDEYFQKVVSKSLKEENSLDRILEYFEFYARYNLITGLETTKLLYNTQNKWFIKKGRYMQQLLQEIITEGQNKKEICQVMSPEEITDFLFISVRGVVYDWCLNEGKYDLVDKMKTHVQLVSSSLTQE